MGSTGKPLLREPTEKEHKVITDYMLHTEDLIVKKYKTRARIWCGQCDTEKTIPLELAKQVEKARICPCCFCAANIHKGNYTYENARLIRIGDTGHYYIVRKRINRKPFVYHKQVAYWDEGRFYARNLHMSMYNWVFTSDRTIDMWYKSKKDRDRKKKFRERRTTSWNGLPMQFSHIETMCGMPMPVITKKEWLENLDLPQFKSNQKKIVMDNLLNVKQMWAIKTFDLKTVKEVYKYNRWINRQGEIPEMPLNVFYLDYFYRNGIRFMDYVDYLDQCELMHIKPGKPKDFYKVHAELATELKIISKKDKEELIKRRYKKLNEKSFKKKNIQIRPLMNVKDIVSTGTELHNCIAGYVDTYAKGQTDLFVLLEGGVKTVAIEVKRSKLIQARAKFNKDPEPKLRKIVNKWYKEAYATG